MFVIVVVVFTENLLKSTKVQINKT